MASIERLSTFTWSDPLVTASKGHAMSGLGFLLAIISGDIAQPPIAKALDFRLAEAVTGSALACP